MRTNIAEASSLPYHLESSNTEHHLECNMFWRRRYYENRHIEIWRKKSIFKWFWPGEYSIVIPSCWNYNFQLWVFIQSKRFRTFETDLFGTWWVVDTCSTCRVHSRFQESRDCCATFIPWKDKCALNARFKTFESTLCYIWLAQSPDPYWCSNLVATCCQALWTLKKGSQWNQALGNRSSRSSTSLGLHLWVVPLKYQ